MIMFTTTCKLYIMKFLTESQPTEGQAAVIYFLPSGTALQRLSTSADAFVLTCWGVFLQEGSYYTPFCWCLKTYFLIEE